MRPRSVLAFAAALLVACAAARALRRAGPAGPLARFTLLAAR